MGEFVPRSQRQREEHQQEKEDKKKRLPSKFDWLKAVVVALLLAIVIRGFFLEPTYVEGPSMQNTLKTGNKVLINKLVYDWKDPQRGEIIVFHSIENKDLIKRIIGLPGETISVKQNHVYINGKMIAEPYLASNTQTSDFPATKIPAGHLFVMGDNRVDSTDSRELGPVSISQVVGRADVVYWPVSAWKWI